MKHTLKLAICILLIMIAIHPDIAIAQTGFACTDDMEIPKVECEALVALYNSTNGESWTIHTGWLDTNTPASWYGITVANGQVVQLELFSNNLSGPIPIEIGNLSSLQLLGAGGE